MENPSGKKKGKRKRRGDESAAASFDRDVFPILLAAVAPTAGPNQRAYSSSAAARLLRRLLSRSPPAPPLSPLPPSLVALLPLLLSSRYQANPSPFLFSQQRARGLNCSVKLSAICNAARIPWPR